jgi:hypothetical protein
VAIINFTPSTVFLPTSIMALTKNNFGIHLSHRFVQAIVNCKEKVGPLKVWELLQDSGRVDGNEKNLSQLRDMLGRVFCKQYSSVGAGDWF